MEPPPRARSPPVDPRECKRSRLSIPVDDYRGRTSCTGVPEKNEGKGSEGSVEVIDHSDPFAVANLIWEIDHNGMFGSVTKQMMELVALKNRILGPLLLVSPWASTALLPKEEQDVIILENKKKVKCVASMSLMPVVIIDSDDEEEKDNKPTPILPHQQVRLAGPVEQLHLPNLMVFDHTDSKKREVHTQAVQLGSEKEGGPEFIGVEEDTDNEIENEDDGLGDIWTEMSFALESTKEATEDLPTDELMQEGDDYCEHSFILKDDLGYVCRICGVIDKSIETIIEIQFHKAKRSTRTYMSSRSTRDGDSNEMYGLEFYEEGRLVTDLVPHPRHMKQMKAHQLEGFKFLSSNLVAENPGGCIMAHAPGSGKTFMIISFLQSFLAKDPNARPLVVMPKGILPTWKKEFQAWQVEHLPLYDFYSVKADSRQQQLEVLKKWVEARSILFLGYKQFSTIVCDEASNKVAANCQEILLRRPSILILDEGHTPRNENTDVLQSLAKVQTPRKVVLSGTLYQNHVKEVFNILNLVRPRFLKSETSRGIVRRIMSKVHIPSDKRSFKPGSDAAFYDLVEYTIQKAEEFKRKVAVIQDLREMTSKILHYYRGDFLDELPGLVDFTVVLNLSPRQKVEVKKLNNFARKFKKTSVGSAVYLHPNLNSCSENWTLTDDNMDKLLETLDLSDGVKAKFFLNVLRLCETAKEKLLVFSQYLPPLKFLERLTKKTKGWALGRKMFVISGDSSTEQREWSMEQFNTSLMPRCFLDPLRLVEKAYPW